MAYGRLDVFWPDGKFETYLLEQPSISVGRSSGNAITLDTDTISRYHFSLTREGSQVYITDLDSANGTFVDGSRLNSNEGQLLRGGEEVQIGHLRMSFHILDDTPTLPVDALAEDTQRIEKETVDFRIDLQLPHIAVTPGSYTSVELTVYNTSQETRQYTIAVSGLPEGWARVNRPLIEIDPDESTLVLINIKPTRRSDSKPGIYYALVTVRSKENADMLLEAEMKVTILPFSGFGMAMTPRRLHNGEKARLHVHNQGSAPLPIQITGRSLDGAMVVNARPSQMTLAAGQRAQVEIEPKPQRSRMFGTPKEYVFDVLVQSQDDAHFLVPSRGRLIDKPPLPSWGIPALIALGIAAVALLIFGVMALLQSPPEPEILAFTVNNPQQRVAAGEMLQLSWTVRQTEHIAIEIAGEIVERRTLASSDIVNGSGEFSFDVPGGEMLVRLIAFNGDRSTPAEQRVLVYTQAVIQSFTATPPEIVRYARQTIRLAWQIVGAESAPTITGLEAFLDDPAPPIITGDSLQITGIAQSDFVLTLMVQGANGAAEPRTITIRAILPECTSNPGNVDLLAAPDSNADMVETLTSLTVRVVDGRDASGNWLRFPLGNGAFGWGRRENFQCGNRFTIEDLRVVAGTPIGGTIQPPLTPLFTPALTSTVTQSAPVPTLTTTPMP